MVDGARAPSTPHSVAPPSPGQPSSTRKTPCPSGSQLGAVNKDPAVHLTTPSHCHRHRASPITMMRPLHDQVNDLRIDIESELSALPVLHATKREIYSFCKESLSSL